MLDVLGTQGQCVGDAIVFKGELEGARELGMDTKTCKGHENLAATGLCTRGRASRYLLCLAPAALPRATGGPAHFLMTSQHPLGAAPPSGGSPSPTWWFSGVGWWVSA